MYIFDFLHSEIGVCGHADFFRLDVDDYEERVGGIAFEELVDFEVGGAQFGARVVPADQLLARVHFLEHVVHALDVIVVEKPY